MKLVKFILIASSLASPIFEVSAKSNDGIVICGNSDPRKIGLGIPFPDTKVIIESTVQNHEFIVVYSRKTQSYDTGFIIQICKATCEIEVPVESKISFYSNFTGYNVSGPKAEWKAKFLKGIKFQPNPFVINVKDNGGEHRRIFEEISKKDCDKSIFWQYSAGVISKPTFKPSLTDGWIIQPLPDKYKSVGATFYAFNGSINGGLLYFPNNRSDVSDFKIFVEERRSMQATSLKDAVKSEVRYFKISGHRAASFEVTGETNGQRFTYSQTIVETESEVRSLNMWALVSNFSSARPSFEAFARQLGQ